MPTIFFILAGRFQICKQLAAGGSAPTPSRPFSGSPFGNGNRAALGDGSKQRSSPTIRASRSQQSPPVITTSGRSSAGHRSRSGRSPAPKCPNHRPAPISDPSRTIFSMPSSSPSPPIVAKDPTQIRSSTTETIQDPGASKSSGGLQQQRSRSGFISRSKMGQQSSQPTDGSYTSRQPQKSGPKPKQSSNSVHPPDQQQQGSSDRSSRSMVTLDPSRVGPIPNPSEAARDPAAHDSFFPTSIQPQKAASQQQSVFQINTTIKSMSSSAHIHPAQVILAVKAIQQQRIFPTQIRMVILKPGLHTIWAL